jgi:predicted  nucleic acid-binding Zn-ribbon protein
MNIETQFLPRLLAKTDPFLNDPSLASALQAYSEHLDSVEQDLRSKMEEAQSALQEYEHAGKGMEEIANRYAELTRESEKVETEIKRLEN